MRRTRECDDIGSAVMTSLGKFAPAKFAPAIVAALACMTLVASPGYAARRHAPHASPPAAGTGSAGGALSSAGQAKPEGGDALNPLDTTSKPKGPADNGGKATDSKSVGPIDLTRPDDGYGNLRRRAARSLFIAAQKKLQVVSPTAVGPHPSATMHEHARNAAGAVVPAPPGQPTAVGSGKAEPLHVEPAALGGAKNNLGLGPAGAHPAPVHVATTPAPPKPPVIGINGTTLHQAGPGIGGPAKDHSAIAGSSYKHK
jgi:hypothetical protein